MPKAKRLRMDVLERQIFIRIGRQPLVLLHLVCPELRLLFTAIVPRNTVTGDFSIEKCKLTESILSRMIKLHYCDRPQQFYEQVESYLLQDEAAHCVILGSLNHLIQFPDLVTQPPYLAAVTEGDRVLAIAVKTAPYKLMLSRSLDLEAIKAIAQDFYSRSVTIPGVVAPTTEANCFIESWQRFTGQSDRSGTQMLVYQLEAVRAILTTNGYLRQAEKRDRELLISWLEAFTREALGNNAKQDNASLIDRRLSEGSLYLWQNNIPVSAASFRGKTPNGIRINFVYTPPEYRRKGYASACVAALSQTLLDRGRKYCFLFADLANSTSNRIYQNIGYRAVCSMQEYSFL